MRNLFITFTCLLKAALALRSSATAAPLDTKDAEDDIAASIEKLGALTNSSSSSVDLPNITLANPYAIPDFNVSLYTQDKEAKALDQLLSLAELDDDDDGDGDGDASLRMNQTSAADAEAASEKAKGADGVDPKDFKLVQERLSTSNRLLRGMEKSVTALRSELKSLLKESEEQRQAERDAATSQGNAITIRLTPPSLDRDASPHDNAASSNATQSHRQEKTKKSIFARLSPDELKLPIPSEITRADPYIRLQKLTEDILNNEYIAFLYKLQGIQTLADRGEDLETVKDRLEALLDETEANERFVEADSEAVLLSGGRENGV